MRSDVLSTGLIDATNLKVIEKIGQGELVLSTQ